MGVTGKIKRVFPGGNTPLGFYSFYDQIITPDAKRILVIKGGPGVGKSTLMKNIGMEMVKRGIDVEFHHCSSDNDSIDGVVIPAIGVALIDGTAPHVVDPKNPGCVDEIIHLGDYWDEDGMRANKEKIINCNHEITRRFERAYRYLRAARAVYDDWEHCNKSALDFGRANYLAHDIIKKLFARRRISRSVGRDRHLFASAITPEGMVNYLNTIIQDMERKIVIEGDPGTGKSTLLSKVAEAALERGLHVEMYHCPLNPDKIEHVVIPAVSTALTKSIEPHVYTPGPDDAVLDMNSCLKERVVKRYQQMIDEDRRTFDDLFEKAINCIAEAKERHDKLETYYSPNMDFEAVKREQANILKRILRYANEAGVTSSPH